jgi:hypothetical protein
MHDPEQTRDEEGFLRILDGIIESSAEFIADDGPYEAESHVADLAAAMHVRAAFLAIYQPENDR